MKAPIKEILYGVAEDILEKIAFIFSFREDDRQDIDLDEAVVAGVAFSGLFKGELIMVVSNGILSELTGNMLGIDVEEETSPEQQHDALKELINVICGNLLPAVAGKQMVFDVDTPKILSGIEDRSDPVAKARLAIEDDGQCDIMLFIDGPIPEVHADDETDAE